MAEPNDHENVVPLGVEPQFEDPPEPKPMGRVHGLGTFGMAVSALIGIVALLALVTIRWPEETGRIPKTVIVISIIGFIVCAALAAAGAGGDTYPRADESRRRGGKSAE